MLFRLAALHMCWHLFCWKELWCSFKSYKIVQWWHHQQLSFQPKIKSCLFKSWIKLVTIAFVKRDLSFSKSHVLHEMASSKLFKTEQTKLVSLSHLVVQMYWPNIYWKRFIRWSYIDDVIISLQIISLNLIRASHQPYCPNLVKMVLVERKL